MSGKDKWVRRFSVDETAKHKNGFTIYKITSVIFPLHSPEAVTSMTVWKRYSDVQKLHKCMKCLHAGLHLKGDFPGLSKWGFFRRFDREVIEDRAACIKRLLDFIAEHKLLFASTDFVNFLQTGYPQPESGITKINSIRSLLLKGAFTVDLSDEEETSETKSTDIVDGIKLENPNIPIYVAAEVEMRTERLLDVSMTAVRLTDSNLTDKLADSFESLNSIDSLNDDLYEEVNKISIGNMNKQVLPDLINFNEPSTSRVDNLSLSDLDNKTRTDNISFLSLSDAQSKTKTDDLSTLSLSDIDSQTKTANSSNISLSNLSCERRMYNRSVLSPSEIEHKTRTEDSYVFEAGYMLSMAAKCETKQEYKQAFEFYKSGIEKMLIGVQTDNDTQRRALIKQKTHRYLSYAETIYRDHLSGGDEAPIPPSLQTAPLPHTPTLAQFRPVGVCGARVLAVGGARDVRYVKVIQKIPNNLTEFDKYFLQRTSETKIPILPNNVPYMVPLKYFIENDNLIFLILSYAPGQKLFDYIKNYVKSTPHTPAREVNLENVFTEIPKIITNDTFSVSDNDKVINDEISVKELVDNSQKLLLNINKVLNDEIEYIDSSNVINDKIDKTVISESINSRTGSPIIKCRDVIPQSVVCRWLAELLTAIEGLHASGVVCRDLNPNNILLGEKGQIIITYIHSYAEMDVILTKMNRHTRTGEVNLYMAPELHNYTFTDLQKDDSYDYVCDYWSFGAIMYELICDVPLSSIHRGGFTSHTILHLPDFVHLEAKSLLTQLLTYEPTERIGYGKNGIEDIKHHPYFKNTDWQQIINEWVAPD